MASLVTSICGHASIDLIGDQIYVVSRDGYQVDPLYYRWNETILNATDHDIRVGNRLFKPCGYVIRCSETTRQICKIDGVPITKNIYGVANLPPYVENVYWITSRIVILEYPHRRDLLGVGKAVKGNHEHRESLSL